jgi:hypothetical protein
MPLISSKEGERGGNNTSVKANACFSQNSPEIRRRRINCTHLWSREKKSLVAEMGKIAEEWKISGFKRAADEKAGQDLTGYICVVKALGF